MMTPQVPSNPKSTPSAPFADFDRLVGRMLRGWPFAWPETAGSEPRALRAFEHMPSVEVKENDNAYTISVELPGLDEKDVKVSIEGDVLTIAGDKKVERTDEKTHFSERSYGSFTRSFSLPTDADRDAVNAKFAKGVLTLDIRKAAGKPGQGKQIEVKPA